MKILWLDPFSGAAGDMFVGALLDLGLAPAELEAGLRTLPLAGWRVSADRVMRGSLAATKFRVHLEALGGGEEGRDSGHAHHHGHDHGHDHAHHHGHDHGHDHGHEHAHAHAHGHAHAVPTHLASHGRTPGEIIAIIDRSGLPPAVRARSIDVFRALAAAEAAVHGTTPEQVHFHEVGAVDAIIDICGSVFGLWCLGIERVYSTPVATGTGEITCAHGVLPIPGPATLNLLRGLPMRAGEVDAELLTPTGAALLATLVNEWAPPPAMRVLRAGYGAGTADRPGRPNVLRATVGETGAADDTPRDVVVLEFEVDDMRAEALGFLRERLDEAGALDVALTPVAMKKNRPGTRVTVLVRPVDEERAAAAIFCHSTTFGLRRQAVSRRALDREVVTVATPLGNCRVKIGRLDGAVVRVRPEYEDVAALARATGLAIDAVEQAVLAAYTAG